MKTVGQEMANRYDYNARLHALESARTEARKDAAVSFSSYLDRLATHVATKELSAIEIVELLRQDAEKWNNQGAACSGGC